MVWLITFIHSQTDWKVGSGRGIIMSLFKTNATKSYSKPIRVKICMEVERTQENQKKQKPKNKQKKKKQLENIIIKNVRNLFKL